MSIIHSPPRCPRPLAPLGLVAAGVLLLAQSPATAQEKESYSHLHGQLRVELQDDWSYRSAAASPGHNDLYLTVEPSFSLALQDWLSLHTDLVLEPVRDPRPETSRHFDDEGVFVEQLFVELTGDSFGVLLGKLNPAFGWAWDAAPGIYGVDFAEDYELTERLGVAAYFGFESPRLGSHRLTASAFCQDVTALSGSLLTQRGRKRRADGGPSNTGDLRSFSLALEGDEIPRLRGLSYQLGFAQQQAGRGGLGERGAVVGLLHRSSPGPTVQLELLAEYVYQQDPDGVRGHRHYYTQAASAHWRRWTLAVSYSLRQLELGDDAAVRDYLVQVSAGFQLPFGFGIELAWRGAREDGVANRGIGARLSYAVAF